MYDGSFSMKIIQCLELKIITLTFAVSYNIQASSSSSRVFFNAMSYKVNILHLYIESNAPPEQYSIQIQKSSPFRYEPRNLVMFGC